MIPHRKRPQHEWTPDDLARLDRWGFRRSDIALRFCIAPQAVTYHLKRIGAPIRAYPKGVHRQDGPRSHWYNKRGARVAHP